MMKPSPNELLIGVADALDETVLPTMDRGVPRNQVQAAIGIVRRCAQAIDSQGPVLHADCHDLQSTLNELATSEPNLIIDRATFDQAMAEATTTLALTYPPVSALAETDLALRKQLAQIAVRAEQSASNAMPTIRALFDRMLEREQQLGLSPW